MNALKDEAEIRRRDYYNRIATKNLRPLWEELHALVPPQPQPKCQPVLWRFDDLRGPLLEAGELISAREATRRVLILENPAFAGTSRITNTLYAGLQLLNPGEIAPAHRHSQSALRFVIEGTHAFTTVNGERLDMSPGDLILTPAWAWHDHVSEGTAPMIWLDGLDIPTVQFFDAGFCEDFPADGQPARPRAPLSSPVCRYPFARTLEALADLSKRAEPHPCHGYRLPYSNPATGGHVLPTIAAFMQRLSSGFCGRPYRSTDATVYVCVEGKGRSHVGTTVFEWGPRDIFVTPSWCPCSHESDEESYLFSYSDRAAQERLGLWRELCE
jgi:gentisate 1,2-dioxygenase